MNGYEEDDIERRVREDHAQLREQHERKPRAREAMRASRARRAASREEATAYLKTPMKVGRGGWFRCLICSGRHTETSKAGKNHREASLLIARGEEEFEQVKGFYSPTVRRLVETSFARGKQARHDSIPQVFRDAFAGDEPW